MSLRMMGTMFLRGSGSRIIPAPKVVAPAINSQQLIVIRTIKSTPGQQTGFSIQGMKKNWSVIPMVIICVGVFVGVPIVGFLIAKTRPDLCFHRDWGCMGDKIDLENAPYLKMIEIQKTDINIPQVAELYREMAEAQKSQIKQE